MKIILLFILTFISFFSKTNSIVLADSNFARAEKSINLYKNINNDNINNVYCLVEKSYFVEILYEETDYYKVNYNGINGFVKKNEVKKIIGTPSMPYPNNINIIVGFNCNLRSTPTTNSTTNNIIATIESNENDLIFLGRIFAEEAIDFGGTTWYYVNYKGQYGYIYNKYIDSITPIYENKESMAFKTIDSNKIINPLTHTPSLIIIIILFIPCIFILIILYAPKTKHKKSKKVKHKDIERY